jgi:hypothetical protein
MTTAPTILDMYRAGCEVGSTAKGWRHKASILRSHSNLATICGEARRHRARGCRGRQGHRDPPVHRAPDLACRLRRGVAPRQGAGLVRCSAGCCAVTPAVHRAILRAARIGIALLVARATVAR